MTALKKTILVVEDDIWFRKYLVDVISEEGHEVYSVDSAYEAIDFINNRLPDLILLDILLPGVNGIALINELSSYSDTRKIPFVICTSVSDFIPVKNLDKYNIKKILDKTSMKPDDIISAIRTSIQ